MYPRGTGANYLEFGVYRGGNRIFAADFRDARFAYGTTREIVQ
ncbi:hypothetical protein [Corallococcus sp. CA053C]|nr:hypothetical protein [Corallococcus sp. CA053C]